MKELIKQYLDQGMSRRQLVSGLSALGMSTVAAKSVAQNLAPLGQGGPSVEAPAAVRDVEGTGGALFVAQLKAAGVEYIFFNPSTGDHSIFDALVDEPGIHLIKGIQEGAVVAMADGYARASGRTGIVVVANIGLPNAMTQMVNSAKDQIPLLVVVASVDQDALGRDQFQEADHHELMTQPITKWFWQAQSAAAIAETTRRGLKFASHTALRAGVPVAAEQYARCACQSADLGAQQIRRADANSSRQGRYRQGGTDAHRGKQSAGERR